MPRETLKNTLSALRAELDSSSSVDADTRRELSELAESIERILSESDPDYREAHASIRDAAMRFEANHPRFARILTDVTDSLAKLGI